jgi:hypothetical protein
LGYLGEGQTPCHRIIALLLRLLGDRVHRCGLISENSASYATHFLPSAHLP